MWQDQLQQVNVRIDRYSRSADTDDEPDEARSVLVYTKLLKLSTVDVQLQPKLEVLIPPTRSFTRLHDSIFPE